MMGDRRTSIQSQKVSLRSCD